MFTGRAGLLAFTRTYAILLLLLAIGVYVGLSWAAPGRWTIDACLNGDDGVRDLSPPSSDHVRRLPARRLLLSPDTWPLCAYLPG